MALPFADPCAAAILRGRTAPAAAVAAILDAGMIRPLIAGTKRRLDIRGDGHRIQFITIVVRVGIAPFALESRRLRGFGRCGLLRGWRDRFGRGFGGCGFGG